MYSLGGKVAYAHAFSVPLEWFLLVTNIISNCTIFFLLSRAGEIDFHFNLWRNKV